jgi:hypothetical protein
MNNAEAVKESTERLGEALSNLVPQLFFDVIARLIPGFVIVWSFYPVLLAGGIIDDTIVTRLKGLLPDNDFFLFLISVIVFYVTSIVFYGLWSSLILSVCLILSKSFNCDESKVHRFLEVLKAPPEFTLRHDYVKLHAPNAGNRITKLKAEIHMSGALTIAFAICLFISVISCVNNPQCLPDSLYLGFFFLIGTIGLFFSNRHFSIRLCRSVYSYSELMEFSSGEYKLPTDIKC